MQDFSSRIAMIGCGHMGGAVLRRWLVCGLDPALVDVVRPSGAAVADAVRVVGDAHVLSVPDVLVLAFKPQQLLDVAPDITHLAGPDTLVISLLAGPSIDQLAVLFPHAGPIVRAMPNLPVAYGQGVTLLAGDAGAHADGLAALMAPLGVSYAVADAAQFDVLTALTGCLPGFLFAFTESLADAAILHGIGAADAMMLARAAVVGSAAMLDARGDTTPADLISEVAGKGGMTQAGIDVLRGETALTRLLHATLAAAANRGRVLAG